MNLPLKFVHLELDVINFPTWSTVGLKVDWWPLPYLSKSPLLAPTAINCFRYESRCGYGRMDSGGGIVLRRNDVARDVPTIFKPETNRPPVLSKRRRWDIVEDFTFPLKCAIIRS